MSKHLFGLIVTPNGTAANNRGETEGNITTLQKVLWGDEVHTTVSAEAIRWAIRYYWQRSGIPVNRVWDDDANEHSWEDHNFLPWTDPKGKGKKKETYIDDDVLGFMHAEAARAEGGESEGSTQRARGRVDKRRGMLEVTRAISLIPFVGDITFNAASVGATPAASRTGRDPVLYGTEVHATRYQYGFALTPEALRETSRALDVVDALVDLSEVAGNQSRFLYDFSPDTVIFRWTDDFAPRMLYGFDLDEDGGVTIPEILRRMEAGDIDPTELVVGGAIAATSDGEALKDAGATVLDGVKAAAGEVKGRIRLDLGLD